MLSIRLLIPAIALTAGPTLASELMIGVVPTNGSTMLLKQFQIPAGNTISSVQLVNNDAGTVFPEVALIKGPFTKPSEGSVVAVRSNVSAGAGAVSIAWHEPVAVPQDGIYFVAIRFPSGPGKQGSGHGPAIGATDVAAPNGSYATGEVGQSLIPIGVDLAIDLVFQESQIGKSARQPGRQNYLRLKPSMAVRNQAGGFPLTINFTVGQPSRVSATIHDVAGRLQGNLFNEMVAGGSHERTWDGRGVDGVTSSSGVYFVTLHAGSDVLTKKIVIAR